MTAILRRKWGGDLAREEEKRTANRAHIKITGLKVLEWNRETRTNLKVPKNSGMIATQLTLVEKMTPNLLC